MKNNTILIAALATLISVLAILAILFFVISADKKDDAKVAVQTQPQAKEVVLETDISAATDDSREPIMPVTQSVEQETVKPEVQANTESTVSVIQEQAAEASTGRSASVVIVNEPTNINASSASSTVTGLIVNNPPATTTMPDASAKGKTLDYVLPSTYEDQVVKVGNVPITHTEWLRNEEDATAIFNEVNAYSGEKGVSVKEIEILYFNELTKTYEIELYPSKITINVPVY